VKFFLRVERFVWKHDDKDFYGLGHSFWTLMLSKTRGVIWLNWWWLLKPTESERGGVIRPNRKLANEGRQKSRGHLGHRSNKFTQEQLCQPSLPETHLTNLFHLCLFHLAFLISFKLGSASPIECLVLPPFPRNNI